MRTWIFQGNPDEYDIDAYLATRPAELVWLVTRFASDIVVGDRVYLWRNQGHDKAVSGVIAEGIITQPPRLRGEDPAGVRFWREQGPRASEEYIRAVMRLVKVASNREVILRKWCVADPILSTLPNLRMAAGTNYPLTVEQATRLDRLWSRTGRDWTRDESVAGLTAYVETYGQPISQLPGSPVSKVALMIGRAVSSVYAKVMNFRSLDPRAAGAGMSGASDSDRSVWGEFFDSQAGEIRLDDLKREYDRLWGPALATGGVMPAEADSTYANVEDEATRLEGLSLAQLLARYSSQRANKRRPSVRVLSSRSYDRDPLVIAIARMRAAHRCELSGCPHPVFETSDGIAYTEVHHILPLAQGGQDTIENVVCLCPAHHREVHLGARAQELAVQLKALRAQQV